MATFTCYLPDDLLRRLDAKLGEGPDFNMGRASRSGILRVLLEQYLDNKTTSVRDLFEEAMSNPRPMVSRAESFRRATQR